VAGQPQPWRRVLRSQVFLVPGFATVGALIAARRANTIGWLFLGLGFVAALHAFSMAYGERDALIDPASLPAGSVIGLLSGWLWPLNYLLLGLIVLLFPDGRLPSPRWRPVASLIVGAWCLTITLNALAPSHDNPLGLQALQQPALNLLTNVVATAAVVGLVVMAAAPFVRFRRAGYQQRQQLKWVAFVVLVKYAQRVCWHWPRSCAAGRGSPGCPWGAGHRGRDPRWRWPWPSCGTACTTLTG
jgi:hypothetical protein